MDSRCCHSLLQKSSGERAIRDAHRLHRGPAKSRTQLRCHGPAEHRDFPGLREPFHFVDRPLAGIRRQHDTHQLSPLQPGAHTRHADHHIARSQPEAEQARYAAGDDSSPPSSVISLRKAISFSARSGVIPGS
jgi:hypothetical protein